MKIEVTDVVTPLPSMTGRKQLIVANTGNATAYYGWESTTVAASNEHQGVPLEPGSVIPFAGKDLDLNGQLFLICAAGESTFINYTQRA